MAVQGQSWFFEVWDTHETEELAELEHVVTDETRPSPFNLGIASSIESITESQARTVDPPGVFFLIFFLSVLFDIVTIANWAWRDDDCSGHIEFRRRLYVMRDATYPTVLQVQAVRRSTRHPNVVWNVPIQGGLDDFLQIRFCARIARPGYARIMPLITHNGGLIQKSARQAGRASDSTM
ncbi:hypothetical protein C8R47DRAFT_1077439 [Mycena vitilis]|nr:hypothetical protein C8R47DRAFT_1077439 [Mycena vitilis]